MTLLDTRIADLEFARGYTLWLLDGTPEADWHRTPPGAATSVAWQVGHLAFAEHRLILERVCGLPEAGGVLPTKYFTLFGRGSAAGDCPPAGELRAALAAVHARGLAQLRARPGLDLGAPPATPHRFCKTVGECLRWCSHHETVHAGQVGLLRRLLGHPPLW